MPRRPFTANFRRTLPAAGLAALCASAALAQIRTERVAFAPGTSSASLHGGIRGEEVVDYVLGASAGQTMTVQFEPTNPGAYFNVMASGTESAIFTGSIGGNSFEGVLPASGDYVVRVYLMRSAARRDEAARYILSVAIAAAPGDFADGNAGGPDWWQVSGVASDDALNIRSGPGTDHGVLAAVPDGTALRNLGCRGEGGSRWCEVEAPRGTRGWVAARYLKEGPAPAALSLAGATGGVDTSRAEAACRQALAGTANVSTADVAVFDVLWGEAGIGVMMTRAGSNDRWSCLSDEAGNVQGLGRMGG